MSTMNPFTLHPVIDADGWLEQAPTLPASPIDPASGAYRCPSPNFDQRETAADDIHVVVLHNISLPPYQFHTGVVPRFFAGTFDFENEADARMRTLKDLRVSSHFLITRRGAIVQFVSCRDRAWHAGVSTFMGRLRVNDFSIGIELEGSDFVPFEPLQYERLTALLAAIDARYALKYIVGHSDIAPGRKSDPGPYFDWALLKARSALFGTPKFAGEAARRKMNAAASVRA